MLALARLRLRDAALLALARQRLRDAALLTLALASCARPALIEPTPAAPECDIAVPGDPPATITLAVSQPVDPTYAPTGRNAAERLVFAQLYETLVRIDCTGAVVRGLAESWSTTDGRVWRFLIRRGAAFSDGTPATAFAVGQAWGGVRAPVDFVEVMSLGERELRIVLYDSAGVDVFADPVRAAARRVPGPWPAGSGPWRVDSAGAGALRLVRATAGVRPDTMRVRVFSLDPRRALDANVDVMVSSDATVLEYARARAGYVVVPLGWNTSYAIAVPGELSNAPPAAPPNALPTEPSNAPPAGLSSAPPADALAALARDVRTEARPAGAAWWAECGRADAVQSAPPGRTIHYPAGDATARALAERIVALAWPADRAPAWLRELLPADYARAGAPIAAALDRPLAAAARTARPLAVILPVPRAGSCSHIADERAVDPLVHATFGSGWVLTPLIDVRDHLIHRGGIGPMYIDGRGNVVFGAVR